MTNKTMKKTLIAIVSAAALMTLSVNLVSADGTETKTVCTTSYGGTTECHEEEVPREEVVHDVTEVDTGIVENVLLAMGLTGIGAIIMFKLQAEQSRFSR